MAEIENDIQLLKGNKCIIGLFDDEVGTQHLTVRKDADEVIYYAFSSEKGLCITTEYGSVRKENLLQEIISLPDGNIGHLFSYIEETGFFLPLASMEDYEISCEAIIDTVRAIKATAEYYGRSAPPHLVMSTTCQKPNPLDSTIRPGWTR